MNTKRIIASFLALIISITSFSGCSKKNEVTTVNTAEVTSTTENSIDESVESPETQESIESVNSFENPAEEIVPVRVDPAPYYCSGQTPFYQILHLDRNRSDEVLEKHVWNPYVWAPVLGETTSQLEQDLYNCISAVIAGEDTFEVDGVLADQSLVATIACPFLYDVIDDYIDINDGIAHLTYLYSPEETRAIINSCAREVEYILNASVVEGDSDAIMAMMIHYNFSKTLAYDLAAGHYIECEEGDTVNHEASVTRALIEREGICQSFAMAEAYIMAQVGLDVSLCVGYTNDEDDVEGHMWVALNLDGETIYLDPTWEDAFTGLACFGINDAYYEENDIVVAGDFFSWLMDASYEHAPATSTTYEPLWEMQRINSITREDGALVIDYVDKTGENQMFTVY